MDEPATTRQERREQRQRKRRRQMPVHGKRLLRVYRDAILKRAREQATGSEGER